MKTAVLQCFSVEHVGRILQWTNIDHLPPPAAFE
jgi:hypothetical protein